MTLIFEKNKPGLSCFQQGLQKTELKDNSIPSKLLRKNLPKLPEISEIELTRHYISLSRKNIGIDNQFYPLGSCTMKYNPKINEQTASLEGFTNTHPLADENLSQGCLQILYETKNLLSEITGMHTYCLQPAAGAHGETAGIMIIKAYHQHKGNKKSKIIIPDSAHGTNPSSAALCGFKVVTVKSDKQGCVDISELKKLIDNDTAGIMLTNPNTLGLFEKNILKISEMIHNVDGLLYCDGANLNAIMGKCKPAEMGFDIMHVNLHKTFATPHGCGGPGSGPIGVKKELEQFLPMPKIKKVKNKYKLENNYEKSENSIGKIISFYGNFLVIVKAYTYIKLLGKQGLKTASETAVLNANYLMQNLKKHFDLPYDKTCMHEFVLSSKKQNKFKVHTIDIAKRLIDLGFHPPTIYFPLIIKEAIMIEPTETETKETLDNFINTMISIAKHAEKKSEILTNAPKTTPVGRLDETNAARKPILKWTTTD